MNELEAFDVWQLIFRHALMVFKKYVNHWWRFTWVALAIAQVGFFCWMPCISCTKK